MTLIKTCYFWQVRDCGSGAAYADAGIGILHEESGGEVGTVDGGYCYGIHARQRIVSTVQIGTEYVLMATWHGTVRSILLVLQ